MFQSRRTVSWSLAVGLTLLLLEGCRTGPPEPAPDNTGTADSIARVLEADTRLGTIRNHAGETAPLHVGLEAYAQSLAELDFQGCPAEFIDAFSEHREAWLASVPFFERHSDLRGELHDVFELIRAYGGEDQAALEEHEQAIWSTWRKVEAAGGLEDSTP